MNEMNLKTDRLQITEFDESMVPSVHLNSLDEDTRNFVPDEVFETEEKAREVVTFLMSCYGDDEGPLVYPVLTLDGEHIGYVQAVPLENDTWEIGYHITKAHRGNGYAAEALGAGWNPTVPERTAHPRFVDR